MLKVDCNGNLEFSKVNEENQTSFIVKVIQPTSFWLWFLNRKTKQCLDFNIEVIDYPDNETTFLKIYTYNFRFLPCFYKTFKILNIVVKLENLNL